MATYFCGRAVLCGGLAAVLAVAAAAGLPPVDGLTCTPQALILFSSLVNTASKGPAIERFPDAKTAKRLSPGNLMRRKLPPMLFFHGKSDRITPFDDVEKFRRRMRWRGNSCELIDFEKAEHSFFNFNVSHKNFELTVAAADRFLVVQQAAVGIGADRRIEVAYGDARVIEGTERSGRSQRLEGFVGESAERVVAHSVDVDRDAVHRDSP